MLLRSQEERKAYSQSLSCLVRFLRSSSVMNRLRGHLFLKPPQGRNNAERRVLVGESGVAQAARCSRGMVSLLLGLIYLHEGICKRMESDVGRLQMKKLILAGLNRKQNGIFYSKH